MAPVQPRKRKSESSPTTSSPQRNPIKKRKLGLTLAQKQALIDNLQLEITERARRLRAQYNIQAQQLRSRVEMRVNRIPTTLRKLKMSELPVGSSSSQSQPPRAPRSQYVNKPPPVPAKDGTSPKTIPRKPVPVASSNRGQKRLRCGSEDDPGAFKLTASSNEISGADNKENQAGAMENPKKRIRGAPTHAKTLVAPSQVLSPTTSNTRVLPRDRPASPTKSMISRPASPVKGMPTKPSSNILSGMVEKAKGTRPAPATRKVTTSSAASSSTGPGRNRKAATQPPSASTTRPRRKVSTTSESSESSTSTVIKKTTSNVSRATKTAPAAKKSVVGSIKSATAKKAPTAKAAPAAATAGTTGRTLRKRN